MTPNQLQEFLKDLPNRLAPTAISAYKDAFSQYCIYLIGEPEREGSLKEFVDLMGVYSPSQLQEKYSELNKAEKEAKEKQDEDPKDETESTA